MKSRDNSIIDRGFYNHKQKSDSMQLKQYITVAKGDKKCLLLRFFNASGLKVRGMEFLLTQLDKSGEVISNSVIELNNISVSPGETFSTSDGIVIDDGCVDFTVAVRSLISGGYKYVDSHGKMVPAYDPGLGKKKRPKKYGKMYIQRGKLTSGALAAIFALIIIIAAAIIMASTSNNMFGKF